MRIVPSACRTQWVVLDSREGVSVIVARGTLYACLRYVKEATGISYAAGKA